MRVLAAWFLTALLVSWACALALPAETVDAEMAVRVKAAYLFQFTRFVQWPEGSFPDEKSPIVIGVLGPDPFGRTLDSTVADEKVRGRGIEIRRLDQGEDSLFGWLDVQFSATLSEGLPEECKSVFNMGELGLLL